MLRQRRPGPDRNREIAQAVLSRMQALSSTGSRLLVAIDGRCAAGKTTLAAQLQQMSGCGVLHMDQFFLRPEQRTAARLDEPGGNVDYERFLASALLPFLRGEAFCYRPYDCQRDAFAKPVHVAAGMLGVVEGSYCCHPALRAYYDLRVFLTVERSEQLLRIRVRDGADAAKRFEARWIPLEERYFSGCGVPACCELQFQT